MALGKGLHPPKANRQRRLGVELHPTIAAALKAGPAGHADLSALLPAVLDQGNTSTCWAHSAATCLYAARQHAGVTIAIPSPLYFAQCVYARMRADATPPGDSLPPLYDQGADLDYAAAVFGKYGEVPFQSPAQGRNTDVPATSDDAGNPIALPELTVPETTEGMGATFGGEYELTIAGGPSSLDAQLMATLDMGLVVWIGGYVGPAYEALEQGHVAQPETTGGGGHAQVIYGYDLTGSTPTYKVRNSWGASWCDSGNALVSEAWAAALWQAMPFAVGT